MDFVKFVWYIVIMQGQNCGSTKCGTIRQASFAPHLNIETYQGVLP